jgi:hypothetical protein
MAQGKDTRPKQPEETPGEQPEKNPEQADGEDQE